MAIANSPTLDLHASRSSAVVVQRVPAAEVDSFLAWQCEAVRAAEGFPGYRGTEVFPPTVGRGDEWVVLIHFQDEEALTRWIDSPERGRLVEEVRAKIGDFNLNTLDGGFGPWFARQGQSDSEAPASWKMALTVLLALFPTVMLLTIFVGPLTSPLGMAASMLIGNAMSISILQWVVMPQLTRVLDPWLRGDRSARRWIPALILAVLGVMTALFRPVTG